jgi:hypothetical protein
MSEVTRMVKITEQLADSVIVAEDLGLSDPSLNQSLFKSAGVVFCKSRLLEELVNEADSRIDALAYFFFGSEGGRHVSNIPSATIPKLTH